MNKKEFADILKVFFQNYNKNPGEIDVSVVNSWYEVLKDYDALYIKKGIELTMQKEKFIPNIATIIEHIKEVPEIIISEEEKIKRWKEKGISPAWLKQENALIINDNVL